MFTGLVEEIGQVKSIKPNGAGLAIGISAQKILDDCKLGDSIAVNGCCLTVTHFDQNFFTVDAVSETVDRTTLTDLKTGDPVNLERALQANSRLGGHFVQGHVDGVGTIEAAEKRDPGLWLKIRTRSNLTEFLVEKGSVTVNGTSLTIAEIGDDFFSIAVIPHTVKETTIQFLKINDKVNVEVDLIGKYIHKFTNPYQKSSNMNMRDLEKWGY